MTQLLEQYSRENYSPGASFLKQVIWYLFGSFIVQSCWLSSSPIKVQILRLFGAQIGSNVRIKPGVKVKFPWRLTIGSHCWIGEKVWIDNLAHVKIENNVCLSQGVYLCTGNHDWSRSNFRLRVAPIHLEEGCWLAAKSIVGPGVCIRQGAVLSIGSVTTQSLDRMTIYAGNPAQAVKLRQVKNT
jgi:putative colanic acid biosynthesis acetyltransferase WcaF